MRAAHWQATSQLLRGALACLVLAAALAPAAAAAAAAGTPPTASSDWRICDGGAMEVTGGGASPSPAHPGDEITFRIQGTLDRNVTGGRLEVWVNYLGFHVYSKAGPLCEAVPCPLPPGPTELLLRQQLPRAVPPGPFLGVFQATDSSGALLFCVDLPFRVSLVAGEADGPPAA